jgi:hypothetical protein
MDQLTPIATTRPIVSGIIALHLPMAFLLLSLQFRLEGKLVSQKVIKWCSSHASRRQNAKFSTGIQIKKKMINVSTAIFSASRKIN